MDNPPNKPREDFKTLMVIRYEKMTRDQLVQELDDRGLTFDPKSSTKTLIELLYSDDDQMGADPGEDRYDRRGKYDDEGY